MYGIVPSASSRFQESTFTFHLTPQQANDIAMSRELQPGAKYDYSVQVQLRFCLLETSCEQEDNFPPSICVKVNSKMCPLPVSQILFVRNFLTQFYYFVYRIHYLLINLALNQRDPADQLT